MKTGKVIVLGLTGVLAANLLFTYVLTRPSGASTGNSTDPYSSVKNSHIHQMNIRGETASTRDAWYLIDKETGEPDPEHPLFDDGSDDSALFGGFF